MKAQPIISSSIIKQWPDITLFFNGKTMILVLSLRAAKRLISASRPRESLISISVDRFLLRYLDNNKLSDSS
jgi:hypothetical protein